MRTIKLAFLSGALFFTSLGVCSADDDDSKENLPTAISVIDFSRREAQALAEFVKISADGFKKAAIVAMLKHGWEVSGIADNEVTGVLKDHNAKIELEKDNRIKIYVFGPSVRQNWADNIRAEMLPNLVLLSN